MLFLSHVRGCHFTSCNKILYVQRVTNVESRSTLLYENLWTYGVKSSNKMTEIVTQEIQIINNTHMCNISNDALIGFYSFFSVSCIHLICCLVVLESPLLVADKELQLILIYKKRNSNNSSTGKIGGHS